jgi:hypothetical protein
MLDFGKRLDEQPLSEEDESLSMELTRKLLRIRNRDGEESELVANKVQRQFERRRGKKNIVVKARQMGLTTWIAARFFLKTICARGVLTVQVAHTREAAESIFRMVQRFWECLPDSMRKGYLKRSRANAGQMVFPEIDSEFRVLTASDSNAGRGLTVQNMHLSEVSRWPGDAAATLAGMRAALVPGGEIVLESTPNGACGCFYEEWQQAKDKGAEQHFFPWWMEPAYVASPVTDPTQDESALIEQHHLTPAQIGYRRTLEAGYRGLRAQEFAESAEQCFLTSGDCCFDTEALDARIREIEEPVETHRGGKLQIFLPPQPDKAYIVAIDPAGGGSDGDYAAVQVIDCESGMQCAELQQRLRPLEVTRAAVKLAEEYSTPGRPALLVVERNNHGHGVLAHLQQGVPYANVYDDKSGVPGWLTTGTSKPAIVGDMDALLAEYPEIFRSKRLLEECRTFVTHPGGRTGAIHGAHDDCVMAMAIALGVRKELGHTGKRRAA